MHINIVGYKLVPKTIVPPSTSIGSSENPTTLPLVAVQLNSSYAFDFITVLSLSENQSANAFEDLLLMLA